MTQEGAEQVTPHHGTTACYRSGCRCDRCRAANTRYDQYRRLDLLQGRARTVDATGTIRRIEALQRLGWSMQAIADRSGYRSLQAIKRITERDRVTVATAQRIDATYEALCMSIGPSTAARNAAVRKGFVPPLAWDDIDDPSEVPGETSDQPCFDDALIQRILSGDGSLAAAATTAERVEIRRRWMDTGRSLNALARLTGWKVERYMGSDAA